MNQPLPTDRLPHQPPMRWIQSAIRGSENEVICRAVLPAACGEEGRAPILLGLEVLAQAGAMLLAATGSRPPTEGRLLSVREARWETCSLPVETPIEARVERIQSSAIGLHQFHGRLLDSAGTSLMETDFGLLVKEVST